MTQKILYFVTEDWYFISHRLSDLFDPKNSGSQEA